MQHHLDLPLEPHGDSLLAAHGDMPHQDYPAREHMDIPRIFHLDASNAPYPHVDIPLVEQGFRARHHLDVAEGEHGDVASIPHLDIPALKHIDIKEERTSGSHLDGGLHVDIAGPNTLKHWDKTEQPHVDLSDPHGDIPGRPHVDAQEFSPPHHGDAGPTGVMHSGGGIYRPHVDVPSTPHGDILERPHLDYSASDSE